ncbi:MAG TPA: hypothetical protein VE863_05375, partial [Pyrinomonadaceae bacterium]|nr:hypothetical protein [Pyrinomonadaceae bacterium]
VGLGAHLAALRRTRAGEFTIAAGRTLDELRAVAEAKSIAQTIVPPDAVLAHLPAIDLNERNVKRVMNGLAVEIDSNHEHDQRVRLRDRAGELVAVGTYDTERKSAHPDVVLGA